MERRRNSFFTAFLAIGTVLTMALVFLGSSRIKEETKVTDDLAIELSPTPEIFKEEVKSYPSPDGKFILTLKNGKEIEGVINQTIYISTDSDDTKKMIFEADSGKDNLLSVPENSFSPDHKYIFLNFKDGDLSKYIVLKTNGENMTDESKQVEITDLFGKSQTIYIVSEVTGWAGNDLILVNTDTTDGKIGPSWWFDVTTLKFTKLHSRFN